jgi:hypothetical protein
MKLSVSLVLLVCAAVCFLLKALQVPTGRVDCMNLGFFFVVLSMLF